MSEVIFKLGIRTSHPPAMIVVHDALFVKRRSSGEAN
jgi:hypothetical protein